MITLTITAVGTGVAVITLTYTFLRNFKNDINKKFDKMEDRFAKMESRLAKQDDRMFWLMTGKKLDEVILEERRKGSEERTN